jgi:hypothetical protein
MNLGPDLTKLERVVVAVLTIGECACLRMHERGISATKIVSYQSHNLIDLVCVQLFDSTFRSKARFMPVNGRARDMVSLDGDPVRQPNPSPRQL